MFTLIILLSIAPFETEIFSVANRGDHETKSFQLNGPATLTISAESDSTDLDDAFDVSVILKRDDGSSIETVEIWSLILEQKKRTKGSDSFRVRVPKGSYFLEISTVLEGKWRVSLSRHLKSKTYEIQKIGNRFRIHRDGKPVAETESDNYAKQITQLLNSQLD